MCKVYILWSARLQKRYVGSTKDLSRRLKEHNRGGDKFTKGGIPWTLLYQEDLPDITSARKRGNFLKSGVGRAWLDANLEVTSKNARASEI